MRAYLRFAFGSPDLYQVMYGLDGVSFSALSAAEARRRGERIGEEAGKVIEKILNKYGKEKARDVNDEVTRLWSSAHGCTTGRRNACPGPRLQPLPPIPWL